MPMSRLERAIFAVCALAFGYFYHGGGWNQNARFAMVRAVVESRTLAVDGYLVYRPAPGSGGSRYVRVPVTDGRFTWEGRTYDLGWGRAAGAPEPAPLDTWAASGDLAFHGGHFYPNKAPGVAFAGVPGYAVLYAVERAAGADPDAWWTLTLNAWLTSILGVGLLSAYGCVAVFRLGLRVAGGATAPAVMAAMTLALGTIYFHYAATLYEHDVAAAAAIGAFALAIRARDGGSARDAAIAGLLAGFAVTANYILVTVAAIVGAALWVSTRERRRPLAYALGVAAPVLLLLAYNVACFGTPATTNYAYENPLFRAEGAALGVFTAPSPAHLAALLFSPFRGLFYTSPVLLLAVPGLVRLLRDPARRVEGATIAAIAAFFLLFNMSFNGWAGGSSVGPRYLVPALPFLAVALAPSFVRWPRISATLAGISAAIVLISAAVDPQCPQFVVRGRPMWRLDPVREYVVPLFVRGTPDTIAAAWREGIVAESEAGWASRDLPASERGARRGALLRKVDAALQDDPKNPLGRLRGPVSVNPIGIAEGGFFALHPAGSTEARWNAFNAGEFLFPESRLSLLPLAILLAAGGLGIRREVRRGS